MGAYLAPHEAADLEDWEQGTICEKANRYTRDGQTYLLEEDEFPLERRSVNGFRLVRRFIDSSTEIPNPQPNFSGIEAA
jgi:hypothetical protein